jgi:hypothetical protein
MDIEYFEYGKDVALFMYPEVSDELTLFSWELQITRLKQKPVWSFL